MRVLLQRVAHARCTVDGVVSGEIGVGVLLLVGVAQDDTPEMAKKLARKVAKLRIFSDEMGKMNLALVAVGGSVLSVSQFTLYADTRSGNRPSFTGAAAPDHARALYEVFNAALRSEGLTVAEGIFGADMKIELLNDGPVTILLEE